MTLVFRLIFVFCGSTVKYLQALFFKMVYLILSVLLQLFSPSV
ncbi:hypothetical protein KUCAC02_006892 [Chaenocephalus aceratus]|uniref:Uncharacterized protein n=1 Tax=Chaenocephalus aceratus TaxID=36190 RepID=A0ACB9VUW4_CHAAC|nr:hypothetical protein KUCAC02_006892 [Chaenocephalus aceratus]